MQVQVNSDANINTDAAVAGEVEAIVRRKLERFSGQITRLEIHLSDENGEGKRGSDDKRCLLEARLAGRDPIAVTEHAATIDSAVIGASDRLNSLLTSTLGKLGRHHTP